MNPATHHATPLRQLARLVLAVTLAVPAAVAHAHVHGVASLAVAVDGPTLTLMLDAPAESLLGFEHPPRNARERDAVAHTRRTLATDAALFLPAAAAGCTPVGTRIESPLFATDSKTHNEHADIEAEYVFRCTTPARLNTLRVELFAAFPRLKRLQVEIAAPGRQTAVNLTPRQRVARW